MFYVMKLNEGVLNLDCVSPDTFPHAWTRRKPIKHCVCGTAVTADNGWTFRRLKLKRIEIINTEVGIGIPYKTNLCRISVMPSNTLLVISYVGGCLVLNSENYITLSSRKIHSLLF